MSAAMPKTAPADIISLDERRKRAQHAPVNAAAMAWEEGCITAAIHEGTLLVSIGDQATAQLDPDEALRFASDCLLLATHLRGKGASR